MKVYSKNINKICAEINIIVNAANSKCHQRLDEILFIFTRTIQEISKVVCKNTMSETRAFIGKLMLYETSTLQQVYAAHTRLRKFRGCIA